MSIIEFIFQSFWHFFGAVILIFGIIAYLGEAIALIIKSFRK